MDWRTKAWIQRRCAALPRPVSRAAYRWLQWLLRRRNPAAARRREIRRVENCFAMAGAVLKHRRLAGATALEIGPGPSLIIPITLWLLGAKRTVSVDLERWLLPEAMAFQLDYLRSRPQWLSAACDVGGGGENAWNGCCGCRRKAMAAECFRK